MRLRRRLTGLTAVAILLAACDPATSPPPSATADASGSPSPVVTPSPTPVASLGPVAVVDLDVVVSGLASPLDMDPARDGTGRLFVAEQDGRVRVVLDGVLAEQPYLDITERISAGGEQGLLGIALHPDYPADPRIFVDYTDLEGDTVVASFEASLDADSADPESERIILQVDQPYPNHNGGALAFGPDGMLYVSLGDGGGGGDPEGSGQRLDTLLAKVLRLDIDVPADQTPGYDIPDNNPWADGADGARPEIWLTGLRNPWRMRFDRATGDLWIGDVGQSEWEEIDVARNGVGGLDFGWNVMEGAHCYSADTCDRAGLTLPVSEYAHSLGCAVIGGVVMRDPAEPELDGHYLFGDECSGNLFTIDPRQDALQKPTLVLESDRSISAIAIDADGSVLITDLGAGEILRVTR
jgi:glucose/arabinose dehydrogenase